MELHIFQEYPELISAGNSPLPTPGLLPSLFLLCRAPGSLITSPYSFQLDLGVPQEDLQLAS